MNHHSSSCPTNILSAKAKIGLPLTDDEMRLVIRDRQKKDNHNMSTRRMITSNGHDSLILFQLNVVVDLILTIVLKNWEHYYLKERNCK